MTNIKIIFENLYFKKELFLLKHVKVKISKKNLAEKLRFQIRNFPEKDKKINIKTFNIYFFHWKDIQNIFEIKIKNIRKLLEIKVSLNINWLRFVLSYKCPS